MDGNCKGVPYDILDDAFEEACKCLESLQGEKTAEQWESI